LFDLEYTQTGRFSHNMLFYKSIEWKHESEYRLVHRIKDGNRVLKIPPEFISEFIIGASVEDKYVIEYTEKVGKIFPHIKISQMKTNTTSFGIYKGDSIDFGKIAIIG